MVYYCSSYDYLRRAEERLQEVSDEAIFYAAYELRCFIEARQDEYLHAAKKYRKSLPKKWKIGQQYRALEKAYSHTQRKQVVVSQFESGFSFTAKFVPLTKRLKSDGEQLGKLLHAQNEAYGDEDVEKVREMLNGVLEKARECGSGNLLCPLLKESESPVTTGQMQFRVDNQESEIFRNNIALGSKLMMSISYEDMQY